MTQLYLHNSLSGKLEAFTPHQPGKVGMYVCGMTVYDDCHLGHARALVVFDMIHRALQALGFTVHYVRNITDIDDKIIARAAERGCSIDSLTTRYIAHLHEDCDRLGVLPPSAEPRATAAIDSMISMVAQLIDNGLAYQGDRGDVYYRVRRFAEYGQLSGKSLEDLRAGSRVGVDQDKEDALDFVLWKHAKAGEPSWPSPWGEGRPGWHIECSAMSCQALGKDFDIHGGGVDLKFPHHENEIAQACGANGGHFARYWLHNGHVMLDKEKMSKSLGNIFRIRDLLDCFHPEVLRAFILGSHYRRPLDCNETNLNEARNGLDRLYNALDGINTDGEPDAAFCQCFLDCLRQDFNTPKAMAVLFDLARQLNQHKANATDTAASRRLASTLRHLGGVLGLLQDDCSNWRRFRPARRYADLGQQASASNAAQAPDDAAMDRLLAEREAARANRDWARADAIRDQLQALDIQIEDGAGGTRWRRG